MADAFLTVIAFEAAYFTRLALPLKHLFFIPRQIHLVLLCYCVVVWIALGAFQRVYEYLDSATPRRIVPGTLRQSILGAILLILFQYSLRLDLSRSLITFFLLFNFGLLALSRFYLPRIVGAFQRGFGTPYNLVIIGKPEKTAKLAKLLCTGSPFRIEIAATLTEDECRGTLPVLLAERVIDEVIFDVDSNRLSGLEDVFLHCDEEGVRTRVAIDFFPHINSDMTLDRVGGAPLLTFSAAPHSPC